MSVDDPKIDDLRERCIRSRAILTDIRAGLLMGESSAESILQLQSIWQDLDPVKPLPTEMQDLLIQTLQDIEEAAAAGSRWLVASAETMNHLARGRQMSRRIRN